MSDPGTDPMWVIKSRELPERYYAGQSRMEDHFGRSEMVGPLKFARTFKTAGLAAEVWVKLSHPAKWEVVEV